MKILLIQTAFIGDVVLATALIEKLKLQHPDSTIDFLLRKGNESILKGHPKLNQVLIFNKKEGKYKNLFQLIKRIRKEKYDYVINAHRFLSSGLLTVFSGATRTIGFDKNPLSFLYNKSIKHEISIEKGTHETERNQQLIAEITDSSVLRPRLYPSVEDEAKLKKDYPYICLSPASVWFTKQWPASHWIELIKQIPDRYRIHLIGGPDDQNLCEQIQSATDPKRVIIDAGNLSILQSVVLIKNAEMTFANDSAAMHFASAVNAPVTAIYCSTLPEFGFGPLSDRSFLAETKLPLSCRPCGLHGKKACPEGHFKCAQIDIPDMLKVSGLIA